MRCQYCGSETALPFRCPFCGKYFCAEHRLPELHACQNISRVVVSIKGGITEGREIKGGGYYRKIFRAALLHFSKTETIHLALGTLMVALVSLSIGEIFYENPLLLLFLITVFVFTFLLHEIGHKIVAEYYGLWAEFRLSLLGIILTIISIFLPIVKIVSPGAVVISGETDRGIVGKVSLSGPLINILLSIMFLILSLTASYPPLKIIFMWGFIVNTFVALSNLIPFSILDGRKILWWNKYVWALTFTTALSLMVIVLIIFSGFW
ncbi:MAG: AN1-type zinc finger domain-containing protein [Candidatus Bathyarchaeia archaeon]